MTFVAGSGGATLEQVRAGVVARLRARQQEIERAVFARVREVAPDPVGNGDAEYVEGLRVAVAAAVEYGVAGLERTDAESPSIPDEALAQARRAARSGVSMAAVLRRYIVGHALVSEYVMQEARDLDLDGDGAGSGGLQDVLRAQAVLLDRMVTGVSEEYTAELARMGRSQEQRLAERVQLLLSGGAGRGAAGRMGRADSRALDQELRYDLDAEHIGVIATGTAAGDIGAGTGTGTGAGAGGIGAQELLRGLAQELDRRLLCVPRGEGTVWGWLGGQRPLAVSELARVLSERWPDRAVCVAAGEPARGFAGWRLTHQQAQAGMVVALRRRGPGGGVTRYRDVALLASALKDELLARGLTEIYLAPLGDSRDGGSVLRETLRAYIGAERSVSSAAAALGVTRSTVEARLRAVEQSLGRLLPACLAELEVALRLEELRDPTGVPTGDEGHAPPA